MRLIKFSVDSGQFIVMSKSKVSEFGANDEGKEYRDIRIPIRRSTGQVIEKQYLTKWQTPVDGIGLCLNDLMSADDLDIGLEPMTDTLDYMSCCQQTMYQTLGVGFLYDQKRIASAVVSRTADGDGVFTVNIGKGGFEVHTGDRGYDENFAKTTIFVGQLRLAEEVVVCDPCYIPDVEAFSVNPGKYNVFALYDCDEKVMQGLKFSLHTR